MGTPPTRFLIEQRFIPQFQDFPHSQSFFVLFWRTLYYIAVSTPWGHVPRRSGGHTSLQKKHGVFLLYSDYLFNYFLPEIPLWFGGEEITFQKSWEGMSPLPTENRTVLIVVIDFSKYSQLFRFIDGDCFYLLRTGNTGVKIRKEGKQTGSICSSQRENGVGFENWISNLKINHRKIGGKSANLNFF